MKKITINAFEFGDHIKYNGDDLEGSSRYATVLYHDTKDNSSDNLLVRFTDGKYDTEYDEDSDPEDMDGWWVDADECTFLSKKEFDTEIKKANPHAVKGLPAKVYFTKDQLVIGDNPITKAEAIKFANNILKQLGKK